MNASLLAIMVSLMAFHLSKTGESMLERELWLFWAGFWAIIALLEITSSWPVYGGASCPNEPRAS